MVHTLLLEPLDELEQLLGSPFGLPSAGLPLLSQSLPSVVEFAAVRWNWWQKKQEDILGKIPQDAVPPSFRQIQNRVHRLGLFGLQSLHSSAMRPSSARFVDGEVHEIPLSKKDWLPGTPISIFAERFKTGLVKEGCLPKFASALAAAFLEMISNAGEHSQSRILPVACYQIADGEWSFSVTDVGCGVLASLRKNPKFSTIIESDTALSLALTDGISGTLEVGRGGGFTRVFKALVDRRSVLRFRTDSAAASWSGSSPTFQKIAFRVLPVSRRGFHVCVSGTIDEHLIR